MTHSFLTRRSSYLFILPSLLLWGNRQGLIIVSPYVAVRNVGQARRNDQEEQDRQARTMAALQLGFCRPGQESSNVLRHLIHRRLGPIGVSDLTVKIGRASCRERVCQYV